ncbi:hypothetical protein AMECASPLE_039501 [Ameca splendens]|uniref:Uncharacterized protein n=1 Tax=Ameca splendens TaxID=208324 RepID=A0ABV1A3U3_9TELE
MSYKEKIQNTYLRTRSTTNAQLHTQPETDSILKKSRTAVYSRSTCLLHYLKSYTERLKQGSFQSNRRANRRERAWCVCVCVQEQVDAERYNPDEDSGKT